MDDRAYKPQLGYGSRWPWAGRVGEALGIAVIYASIAQLSFVLSIGPDRLCALWLPAGMAASALLLRGPSAWPGVACGALAAALWRGAAPQAALLTALGEVLGPLGCVMLLARDYRDQQPALAGLSDLRRLARAAGFGGALGVGPNLLAALLGAPSSAPLGVLLNAWLANALGTMLLVALVLAFRGTERAARGPRRSWLELVLAFGTLLAFAVLGFTSSLGRPSLVYPALTWCALRFGLRGGSVAALLLCAAASVVVEQGVGPLVRPVASETVLHLQILMASIALVGQVIGTATVERAALVERLESALQVHRAVVHSSPLATVAIDEAGRLTAWNSAAERMFGYRAEEVLGKVLPIVPPHLEAEFKAQWQRVRGASTATAPYETLRLRRDGSTIQVRISAAPLIDSSGRMVGGVALLEDIEARRKAELARDRLAAVVEATTDLVALADAKGQLIYLNPAGRDLLGFDESFDPALHTLHDLHAVSERARLPGEILHGADRSGVWSGELSLLHRDGTPIPVHQIVIAQRKEATLDFYALVAHDVRERQEAERILRITEDQLRQAQKMEAIGRLAGGVAHDFNNLLTGLLGFSELALMRLGPDDPLRGELEQIHAAAERGAALTTQLLAFSRKQVVELRNVDVNALVEGLQPLLRRLLDARIHIEQKLAPRAGYVRTDPNQLEQVIMNLALNARDAMPDGGVLSLETSNVTLATAEVIADDGTEFAPGRYVRITVADTGVGMDPTTRVHIFEPFFTTKERGKGTGLGLSTVYGVAKQCGGSVLVESALGSGSTFVVLLPMASAEHEAVAASPAERITTPSASETILLAEDDPAVRELSRRVLSAHGYRVLAAESAEDALRLLSETRERIDLLLTDVMMPGRSGPELAKELRRTRLDLPVLFMSGYTDTALAGCSASDLAPQILQKPFVPRVLLQRVRDALSGVPGVGERAERLLSRANDGSSA